MLYALLELGLEAEESSLEVDIGEDAEVSHSYQTQLRQWRQQAWRAGAVHAAF